MRELIDRLKDQVAKYGEKIFSDNVILQEGCYIKINKDNIEDFSCYNYNRKNPLDAEVEDFFKDRFFNEGMISSNKCLCSDKKIFSVTPYALILPYSNFEAKDKKGRTINDWILNHFTTMNNKFSNVDNIEEITNKFLKILKILNAYFKENNCIPKGKVFIFFDNDVKEYEKAFNLYFKDNIFLHKDKIREINGVKYGEPTFGLSLDTKKIFASSGYYSKTAVLVPEDEAILLANLDRINYKALCSNNENNILNIGYPKEDHIYLSLTKGIKGIEINSYSTYEKDNKKLKYTEYGLLSTNFEKVIIKEKDILRTSTKTSKEKKEEGRDSADSLQEIIDLNNSWLLSSLFINKDNLSDYKKKDVSAKYYASHQNILFQYFKKGFDCNIINAFENIFYNTFMTKQKDKDISIKKTQRYFDFMLSVLNCVDIKGGYNKMAINIKEIWDKLKDAKSKKIDEYNIETDEEFFFIAGQVLYYLSSLSKSKDKKGLIRDVAELTSSKTIKDYVMKKYAKYNYCILHESFINVLYKAVLMYKVGENISSAKTIGKYYYQAGLIGDNICYHKLEQ